MSYVTAHSTGERHHHSEALLQHNLSSERRRHVHLHGPEVPGEPGANGEGDTSEKKKRFIFKATLSLWERHIFEVAGYGF